LVLQVFERGVTAIPLSVDLWLHYITFTIDQCQLHDVPDADQKIEMYDFSCALNALAILFYTALTGIAFV